MGCCNSSPNAAAAGSSGGGGGGGGGGGAKASYSGAASELNGLPTKAPPPGMALLIIDPQNDFHPPNGSLAVQGAVEDTQRTVAFLEKHGDSISEIVVTLDTHHKLHIAHPGFWTNKDGGSPTPFTLIESKDIEAGTWKPRQADMQAWSLEYAQKLEAGGRFKICIWPEHCLLGTPGHAVYQPLADALNAWAARRSLSVTWVLKGQNNRTEMYSALKAEVPLPDDPATQLNKDLIKKLQRYSKVICCGQAKSHCVNYTVRDLLSEWPKERVADIVLLTDACSPVTTFEEAGQKFEEDMKAAGVTCCKTTEVSPTTSGGSGASTGKTPLVMGAASSFNGCPTKPPSSEKVTLLIIDPQNDFHTPNGSLGVPGSVEDTKRITQMLEKNASKIDRVVVTLDTHHKMHIAHGPFWVGKDGSSPGPFTTIEAKDIEAGAWKAKQPEMEAWSLEYAKKLEAGGRFKLTIWPEHCLLGTPGHAVYQPLADALNNWANQRQRSVIWVLKGQNNRTEMYSALKAEVELPDDPATKLNMGLIKELQSSNKVIVCGQAKSHCVNHTVRDLASKWPKNRMSEICVLEDGCSPVPGCDKDANEFVEEMKKLGVQFRLCNEAFPTE